MGHWFEEIEKKYGSQSGGRRGGRLCWTWFLFCASKNLRIGRVNNLEINLMKYCAFDGYL